MEQVEKSAAMVNNQRRLGTVREAAEILKVPVSWIYDRSRRDAIPMLRLGKYVRFDLDELLRWASKGCPKV